MNKILTAMLLAATVTVGCGGVPGTLPEDDAMTFDGGVEVDGSMPEPDASVEADAAMMPDTAVTPDASVEQDASTTPDASEDDAAVELDAGVEPDAAVEADAGTDAGTDAAVEPSAYRLEVWGFTVPSMRRRFQVAAPGYTNWQTHDPEASLLAKRGPDVIVGVGLNRSVAYDNTTALSASEAIVSATYPSLANLASITAGFVDYEQNGDITPIPAAEIESLTNCAVGWMSAEQVADTLATGNIQTSTCPAPVHAGSGTAMFNADFQIEWRIVAVE